MARLALLLLALALATACSTRSSSAPGAPHDGGVVAASATPGGADAAPGPADVAAADGALDDAPAGAPDAGPHDDAEVGCGCPPQTHCDERGLCQPDVCHKGAESCSDLETVKVCDAEGASFAEVPCPEGETCFGGQCWEPICEAGEIGACEGAALLKCNSLGIEWVPYPCPAGEECRDGACEPIPPNVILLVDTSGSMNYLPDGASPLECAEHDCPPWQFPSCDDPQDPKTRLGKVKQALRTVIESGAMADMELALQRFPQRPYADGLLAPPVDCQGGYWTFNDNSLISGDNDAKITSLGGWFGAGLDEILPVRFGAGGTDLDQIATWFDDVESVAVAGGLCGASCEGPCLGGSCYAYTNPELRAIHGTPLGKSLFYASEYLRHEVLIQGKPCASEAGCPTPHHACVDGACHDDNAYCRPNVIIAFTDGEDTENVHTDDFFHPRVQAKRLHYGLGCGVDADCLSGASCESNLCSPPAGVVDEAALACETGGLPCTSTADCPDPCASWTSCQGQCRATAVTVSQGGLADAVRDHAGVLVPVTVHVVDASGVEGQNQLVAAYGGGAHFSIDLTTPDALVEAIEAILGDSKAGCGAP